jgi:DNA-binding CsgD family transcriptional regulator
MEKLKCFEFNTRPKGGEVEVRHYDEPIYVLTENHRDVVSPIYEEIRLRFPHAYSDLCLRYKESIKNIRYFEFRVVCGFIKCNWGIFDNKWDIDENGDWHFEYFYCPLVGECKSEGRICCPVEKTEILDGEMRVLLLIVAGMKTLEIADELCISPKTVETHVYNMLKKLHLHSNSQLVDWYHRHYRK